MLLLADGVGADAGVLLVSGVMPLGYGRHGVAGAQATDARELALSAFAIQVLEASVGELLLAIVGVFGHGSLVEALVVLAAHCLARRLEAVALTYHYARRAHAGRNAAGSNSMALPSLHLALQVSGPVVERLASIRELSAATQEIGVGLSCAARPSWSTSTLNEGVLVNLLVSRFGSTLVVVFVGLATDSGHVDRTDA